MFVNANKKVKLVILSMLTLITLLVLLNIDWSQVLKYDGVQNRMLHAFGGISLALLFVIILSNFNITAKGRIVTWLDRYSYQIYLLHHPFIIGPLSLIAITPWLACNISIILSLTIFLSLVLTIISNRINSYL